MLTEVTLVQHIRGMLDKTISSTNFKVAIQKSGCLLIETAGEMAIEGGVYMFMDAFLGVPYVGQSIDISRRIDEHGDRVIKPLLAKFEYLGDKKSLRNLEQYILNAVREAVGAPPGALYGNSGKVANLINARDTKKFIKANFKMCP
mgnify:FL=1